MDAWPLGRGRGIRFRLWAPSQRRVGLVLGNAAEAVPMERRTDGFFEAFVEGASAGALYRFALDDGARVPDPASRFQPQDVHGPSEALDPDAYAWTDHAWTGLRWEDAVLYELHVGAFTPEGTFDAAAGKLDHLAGLGVTAVELMPIAAFSGRRGWGYDGVCLTRPMRATAVPSGSRPLSRPRIGAASRFCSTSSTITSARTGTICASTRPTFSPAVT